MVAETFLSVGVEPIEYDAVRSFTCISPREGHRTGTFSGWAVSISDGVSFSKALSRAIAPSDVSSSVHDEMRRASDSLKLTTAYREMAMALALVEAGVRTPNATRSTAEAATKRSRTKASHR